MITPRWYQEESINSIYHYFMNGGKGNPVIALPTASGKSIVPAVFIERVMRQWPNQRFLIVTHVKELIRQNADKIEEVWATAPYGIYSAGLKRRDIIDPIIFGGIQSMIKIAQAFGHRDIIFIDECHLVSQDENSLYLKFIAVMKMINSNLKVIGLTATKYRMGQGMLTDDGLFTDIIYDMTDIEGFNRLLSEGYLSPLIPKQTKTKLDVSNVGMQKGEFIASQLQYEIDRAEITWAALQEACYLGQNRQSWLIFASGIEHSNHIAEMLNKLGVECASVHSKQSSEYNDSALKAHKELRLRAIASFSKLTTGLDHPAVDFIIDLRPTMSVVLHVQKNGRGMRLFPGKRDCLVADFAKNAERLGPVNDPVLPRKKGDKEGQIPIKLCQACGVYHHIKAVKCDVCGTLFDFQVKITERASISELIREPEAIQVETFDVTYAVYSKHNKIGKPPSLKVVYFSGINAFTEYICFEHNGYAKKNAHEWWKQRHTSTPPLTIDDALKFTSELRLPKRLRIHVNKRYLGRPSPEILGAEY